MTAPRRAAQPTQARHPWRATVRTLLAVVVGIGIVLPVAWGIMADALAPYIAAEVLSRVGWVVAGVAAVATAITRIMAIPAVNAALTRIGLGAAPADSGEPPVEEV